MLLSLLALTAHGQNWQQVTSANQIWNSMAGSQHGSNLVAVVFSDDPISYTIPGLIYASTNGGQTWLPTSCKRRLKSAAGGARKVLHPPGKEDWIFRSPSSC